MSDAAELRGRLDLVIIITFVTVTKGLYWRPM